MVVLAARELQRVKAIAQAAQAGVVVTRQRLFEPRHAEMLELERDVRRDGEGPPSMASEAGQDTCLIGVDEDREPIPQVTPNCFYHANVVARVVGVKAHLHRLEAIVGDAAAILHPALG